MWRIDFRKTHQTKTIMITKFNPEEEAQFPAIREKWLKVGRRSSKESRFQPDAWDGVCEAYEMAGKKKPLIYFWLRSPLELYFARSILRLGHAQLRDQLSGQLSDQLRGQLRDQLRGQLSNQLSEDLNSSWMWWFPGQFDAWWISFYEGAKNYCNFDRLKGVIKATENCCMWMPFEQIVFFSASPTNLDVDEQGRPHKTDGPAMGFADGFGVYAWHGVRVPAYVIEEPDRITVQDIESEKNAEIRRVKMERFGLDKYLLSSGAKEIHKDDFGMLLRKDIPGDEPLVMVKVVNSTAEPDGSFKDYFLRVHPELRPLLDANRIGDPQSLTARNAVASTFGLRGDDYELAHQT
jgi:hypothetical protein